MSPHKISVQTPTEWIHRRIEHLQTRRYRKTPERTPLQSPHPEEIKSSDERLGERLGGDWKLADNVGK